MTDSSNEDTEITRLNELAVLCQYCGCKILSPNTGSFVSSTFKLPFMTEKKNEVSTNEGEDISEYWFVDDMFKFENVGFTHTVNDIKYLSCADCDMGPIGYHVISTKKCYVALARVKNSE